MCGIGGAVSLSLSPLRNAQGTVELMNDLLRHRGPDGEATWVHDHGVAAFAHRRLAIIDLDSGDQPMTDGAGNWVTHNGEIYNYIELRGLLGKDRFHTSSDTEVILRAYRQWGEGCLERLRGMFSFALWDEETQTLFAARDRFGIKPFYCTVVDGVLYFASEVKALLPFLPKVETDLDGFADYLTFQFPLAGKTLFEGVQELLPGHFLRVRNGTVETQRYWEVYFEPDFDHTGDYYERRTQELLADSISFHLRADVPIGSYLSGGLDSSIVASLASTTHGPGMMGFTGRFGMPGFDESRYARSVADDRGFELHEIEIGPDDFVERIGDVVYHLDYPVAGPRLVPAVHGLRARGAAPQGRARRPGRRRDLRRLRALPDRVLRAVHQRRDRGDDAQRQLRRHLRVDHPEPADSARVQAAAAGVLARGPLRGSRRALLPLDQPGSRPRRRDRLVASSAATRRSRPSRRSSTAKTSRRRATSTA